MARSKIRSDWARRYPPLTGGVLALVLAAAVLPSSLNVPQTNPQQTLEFAPVPPADEDAPPPPGGGDLGSLALGTSAGPAAGRTGGDDGVGGPGGPSAADEAPGAAGAPPPPPPGAPGAPPPPPPGEGSRPSTKQCVGNPPRQTEDPLSPPCVAFFDGDNGGSNGQRGVTRDEVRVLFHFDMFGDNTTFRSSRGAEPMPNPNSFFDLGKPEQEDEAVYERVLRMMQRRFNQRYQTFNRFVHFYVSYGSPYNGGAGRSPEARRADAAGDLKGAQPFAVVTNGMEQNSDAYVQAMAQKGVVTIVGSDMCCGSVGQPADFYRSVAGRLWSYQPSTENRARLFTSYVCDKVVPHRVSYSGNDDHGDPRVLGLLATAPDNYPDFDRYTKEIVAGVKACGGEIAETGYFEPCAYSCDYNTESALGNMARFQDAGVTTILWAGGNDNQNTRAAATLGYRPEWVLAGDESTENTNLAHFHDQSVWQHARVVTTYPRIDDKEKQPCVEAGRETDPSIGGRDLYYYYCDLYTEVRQLFTGIQVAGPKLSPNSLDEGFHAIPAVRSDSPYVPACFYEPGDYTCVKDAQVAWWDPEGTDPANDRPGCYRMMQGGKRYLAGAWPEGDVDAQRRRDDPCNYQGFDFTGE